MSAEAGGQQWGGGILAPAAPGQAGVGEDEAARLAGMDARAAIESLSVPGGAVKLPVEAPPAWPGPVAEAYYWSDADIVGICGPVGSGKTTTKMRRKLRRAIMMPWSTIDRVRRYKVLFIRQTYRQLWSTTIPSYLETFPKAMGTWSGGRGDPVTHAIQFEDEDGPIEFTAEFMAFGDDIVASMRGVQTTDIDLNEADTMPVDILTVGIGRIDRWPGRSHFEGLPVHLRSYGQIDCDFNAPDEDNWTYGLFYDEAARTRMAEQLTAALPPGANPIRIQFFNQPGYGAPGTENLQNLGPAYYPRQIAAMRLAGRGDMIDRLVYNKVVYLRAGDPVFAREFNRRIHVAAEPIEVLPAEPLRIGLDQGFKGAAVIAQFVDGRHWRILAELHFPQERLLAREFGLRLAELLASPRFASARVLGGWGDMAGEHGASQAADENATWNRLVGTAAGISIRPQRIGTNRIQPRLEAVRAGLEFMHGGQPGLLIDPSCKFLIRGFEARYVWTEETDASGDKRKVPDKRLTEANVMDALQYLALSEVRGDGTSRLSFPDLKRFQAEHRALRGRLPPPEFEDGLSGGWDSLNPYGA